MKRWNPFDELYRMHEEMEHFFSKLHRNRLALGHDSDMLPAASKYRTPKADLQETETKIIARFELPGATKDNIELEVTDDAIQVQVKQQKEVKKDKFHSMTSNAYYRSFALPKTVKPEETTARYENGVLHVEMLKTENTKKGSKVDIQ